MILSTRQMIVMAHEDAIVFATLDSVASSSPVPPRLQVCGGSCYPIGKPICWIRSISGRIDGLCEDCSKTISDLDGLMDLGELHICLIMDS